MYGRQTEEEGCAVNSCRCSCPQRQRCRLTCRPPRPPLPPRWTQKGYFLPVRYNLSSSKQFGMSYEYHKHPKKNWGQPPAFRLPPADRTGSEKIDVPSSILNKRTIHVHMHQGGTGRYLFFSRPYSPFLFAEGNVRWVSLLASASAGIIGFPRRGIFLHSLPFAPLQPSLFSFGFSLLSWPTPERAGGWFGSEENGDELPGSQSLARWCRSCGLVSSGLERTQPHLYVVWCGGG